MTHQTLTHILALALLVTIVTACEADTTSAPPKPDVEANNTSDGNNGDDNAQTNNADNSDQNGQTNNDQNNNNNNNNDDTCEADELLCDGACVDTNAIETCGGCAPCPGRDGAVATCDQGSCGYVCDLGAVDVNGDLTNDAGDGCECRPSANGIEACDDLDNDCDGEIDEGCDDDGDGYCEFGADVDEDALPAVCPLGVGDCDDEDPDLSPGAPEVCDGVDNNCGGGIDDDDPAYADLCANQNGVCGGTVRVCQDGVPSDCTTLEQARQARDMGLDHDDVSGYGETLCDGMDNDCNGSVDENCATNAESARMRLPVPCEGHLSFNYRGDTIGHHGVCVVGDELVHFSGDLEAPTTRSITTLLEGEDFGGVTAGRDSIIYSITNVAGTGQTQVRVQYITGIEEVLYTTIDGAYIGRPTLMGQSYGYFRENDVVRRCDIAYALGTSETRIEGTIVAPRTEEFSTIGATNASSTRLIAYMQDERTITFTEYEGLEPTTMTRETDADATWPTIMSGQGEERHLFYRESGDVHHVRYEAGAVIEEQSSRVGADPHSFGAAVAPTHRGVSLFWLDDGQLVSWHVGEQGEDHGGPQVRVALDATPRRALHAPQVLLGVSPVVVTGQGEQGDESWVYFFNERAQLIRAPE